MWFTEGLAEYFAHAYSRLYSIGNHKKYNLTTNFQEGTSEYWVGLSAYLCLEQIYDRNAISNVVVNSYTQPVNAALQASTSENLDSWNEKWHQFMEDKEYRKFLE